ncbi:MAG: class I SAM-dependent methyltransferase [Snowella sp.]|nr:class I SAM-dependent methyltransferase [Snowella sp.]
MTKQTWGLDASLYDYYQAIAFREPEILKELRQATSQLPMANMQIAPEQGQFMALLVQLTGARKILEIGVFTGYSSLAMALALPPQGRILGCEISAEYAAIARQFWQKAGVSEKIDVLLGPAVTSLEQLLANGEQESFDLAFIDANKSDYDQYYELSLQLVRPGGLILIDNVLWYGKVADETVQDKATQSIRHLNAKLHQDLRISLSLVPIGDGLTLALKHHC